MKREQKKTVERNGRKVKVAGEFASLSDLRAAFAKHINLKVYVPALGEAREIPVRVLTAWESNQLEQIVAEALPPAIETAKEDGTKEIKYDASHPDYENKRTALQREARALALYWAVPQLSEGKEGLTVRKQIQEWVESLLPDSILDQLYMVARMDEKLLEANINFT